MAVLTSLAVDVPPSIHELNPGIPEPLAQVIHQLLAKEPDRRPANGKTLAARLGQIANEMKSAPVATATPVSAQANPLTAPREEPKVKKPRASVSEQTLAAAATEAIPKPLGLANRRKNTRRWLIGALLAGFGALLIAGGIILTIRNPDGTTTEQKLPKGTTVIVNQDGKKTEFGPKTTTETGNGTKSDPKKEPPAVVGESTGLPPVLPIKFKPVPIGQSPLDKLDPKEIPAAERMDLQPKELVAVIGSHTRRHWHWVTSVAISPDGKLAASGSSGASDRDYIVIWDMATQTPKQRLRWMGSWLHELQSMQFANDSQRLFIGIRGNGNGTQMIDLSGPIAKWLPFTVDGKETTEWRHMLGFSTTALESDRTLAVYNYDSVTLIHRDGGTPKVVTNKFPLVGRPHFAVTANQMVYVSPQGKLRRATVKGAKLVDDMELPIPLESKEALKAVRDDGKLLALLVKDQTELWDVGNQTPMLLNSLTTHHPHSQCFFSPDGRWLALVHGGISVWQVDGPKPKLVVDFDKLQYVSSFAFSRDGKRAIVGTDEGFVRFLDLSGDTPKEISPPAPASVAQDRPLLDANGTLVLSENVGEHGIRKASRWDLTDVQPVPGGNFESGPLRGRISKGRWLAGGLNRQPLGLFRFDKGGKWVTTSEAFDASYFAVSPTDGSVAFSLSKLTDAQPEIVSWDFTQNEPTKKWSIGPLNPLGLDHETMLGFISCSADGRLLTVGRKNAKDNTNELTFWKNLESKPELAATISLKDASLQFYRHALSPNGNYLAHTKRGGYELALEDLSKPTPREVAKLPLPEYETSLWLAFNPEGTMLASASQTGIQILEVPSLKPLWTWSSSGTVHWCEWAADGRHLFTHNGNKTVYVLRLNTLAK